MNPQTNGPCPQFGYYDPNYTNHIKTFGLQTVSYDAAGNLTQDGTGVATHTYQWDAEGMDPAKARTYIRASVISAFAAFEALVNTFLYLLDEDPDLEQLGCGD